MWRAIRRYFFEIFPHLLEEGPPFFLVALAKKRTSREQGVRCFSDDGHSRQLYIWPCQLQRHFLCLALIFLFSFWGDWVIASLSILFLCFLLPYIIYFLGRVPVLEEQLERWPKFMDYWLKDIPDEIDFWPKWQGLKGLGCWLLLVIKRPRSFFIRITSRHNSAVRWSPLGSPQESMLRASLIDFFIDPRTGPDGPSIWHHQAFIRWVIYWGTPVWGAYIILVTIATSLAYYDISSVTGAHEKIAIATFGCWLYSLYFVWKQTRAFSIWTLIREEGFHHHKFLPPHLVGETDHKLNTPLRLQHKNVMMIFGIVTAAYTGVVLALAKSLF